MGKGQVDIDHVGEEDDLMQNDGSDIGKRHITCIYLLVPNLVQLCSPFEMLTITRRKRDTG